MAGTDGDNIFRIGLGRAAANFAALTPLGFLPRAASIYPDRVAMIHGDRRISYREFDARARRLASALSRRGIGPVAALERIHKAWTATGRAPEDLWALAIGYVLWGEVPNALALGGIAVIVASGLYILHRERVRR